MNTENLLMDVVRMLREREIYFDKEWIKGQDTSTAIMMRSKANAYNDARQMLMAALTGNVEILREYDQYRREEEG